MKKFLLILVFLILCPNSFADVIKLKSGKTVEGTITEQTNEYIKIDSDSGMEVTYYLDEIQTISFKSDSSYSLNVNQPEIHIHNPGAMAEYNKKALALNQLTIQEKKKDGGTTEYIFLYNKKTTLSILFNLWKDSEHKFSNINTRRVLGLPS